MSQKKTLSDLVRMLLTTREGLKKSLSEARRDLEDAKSRR